MGDYCPVMSDDLLQHSGLSLDRLQSFCCVAEAGGVTKAAKGDPARQSLFSRQIKELEEFFGVELMRRSGRGVALTEAGRVSALSQESSCSACRTSNRTARNSDRNSRSARATA